MLAIIQNFRVMFLNQVVNIISRHEIRPSNNTDNTTFIISTDT